MGKKNRNAGTTDASTQDDLNVGGDPAELGAEAPESGLESAVDESPALEEGGVDTSEGDDLVEQLNGDEGPSVLRGAEATFLQADEASFLAEGNGPEGDPAISRYAETLLNADLNAPKPEIDPNYVGQIGYAPEGTDEAPDEIVDAQAEEPEVAESEAEPEEEPTPEPEGPEEPVVVEKDPTDAELRNLLMGVIPAQALKAWPTKHLILFQKTGAYPEKTRRGNWVEDIRRGNTLRDWSGSELEDWLDGKIPTPNGVDADVIVEEIYRRWRLPGNWTLEAARAFIFNGERPGYTAAGVLIEDRAREASPVHQWTYQELRAAILGEIPCEHKREELVSQLRIRLGLKESFTETKLLENLDKVNQGVSMDDVILKAKLEEYKAAMTKYPVRDITEEHAAKAQVMLYKTIRQVLAREPSEFTEGWLTLLNFINVEYNELFYPERARLGWSALPLQKAAMTTFEELLSLMIFTRAPADRLSGAKMFNIETIMRYVPEDQDKQNLHGFYSQPY